MKFDPKSLNKRDLHELFANTILPRPIAFVSTIGEDGIFNLAPFSFFTPLCLKPAVVGLSIGWKRGGKKKDTLRNIEFTKDFVVNVVTDSLAEAMNKASAEYSSGVDEFEEVGLTAGKSDVVQAPLVVESPVNLECQLVQILALGEIPSGSTVVIGEVVLVHIRDDLWKEDHIEISKLRPIGRLGGDYYCRTTDLFEMKRLE